MPFLVWDDRYKVNIAEIDMQHKRLFDMVNDMHKAMKSGSADDIIGIILEQLINYCDIHFVTEEKYMSLHNYPDFISHKKAHEYLTKKTHELYLKFKSGEKVLSFDVMDFLKDWLQNHILSVDKKFGPYLISKGVK
ncbi:MAG: bacteriohemerythrin [Thermodesulfovibrionales bacterium]|nr:bacteriohemerythrin [Thermodesulfovibrionales bacterium]